ncbi:PiggyBac transposable element-derived protein 4 [Eumeta japonica]|uniref:PiggyBac transposable element-derived protein 4 n=1 Tax=Eumeta variegata TaxID=151549 RepID=A0A4C1TIJ2_EUMVA|nr:PiggyBac transposable element-derived protein 4 [Eumeta japonica]
MENEAGPSRPKRPRQLVLDTEIEDLLLEEDDTDDDFIYNDEEESSSDDDDDDNDHSQPPTLQLPTHRRVSPVCEIESPSHQDFEETGPPSSSSDSVSTWTLAGEMKNLEFSERNVFLGPHNGDPVDYFNFFFDDAVLQFNCQKTNEQAAKLLLSENTKEQSRITRWKDLTLEELKIFLGLLFHMGTIQLNRIQDYWKKDRLFSVPIFSEQMSRNRFLIIMRCLHFTSETSSEDPLYKIRFVIEYFNKKMADCYYPGRQLSLDESMVLWRGRLLFRQYIKN